MHLMYLAAHLSTPSVPQNVLVPFLVGLVVGMILMRYLHK